MLLMASVDCAARRKAIAVLEIYRVAVGIVIIEDHNGIRCLIVAWPVERAVLPVGFGFHEGEDTGVRRRVRSEALPLFDSGEWG